MMKRFLPVLVLLLAASAAAQETVVEEIIVRVNDAIITRSDLRRARQQLQAELKQAGQSNTLAEQEKDLLRDLIDQQLLVQKANDLGISADTDLIKRLDDIRKNLNLDSLEALEKVAVQQGVSYEDFKQNLRNNILTQATIGREVGSKIRITQDETHRFYDENKSELERPEQVRISEILISTEQPSTASADSASVPDTAGIQASAKQEAEQALQALQSGTSFEDVARKYSDGPTASQGGDLGFFRRGMLDKALEQRTFDQMKAGDLSEIIPTRQGFVILKVTEHQDAGIPEFQEVQNRVQEAIYMQKLQPALREYLNKLRQEAFIEMKPGYVDTGAVSPASKDEAVVATSAPADKDKK